MVIQCLLYHSVTGTISCIRLFSKGITKRYCNEPIYHNIIFVNLKNVYFVFVLFNDAFYTFRLTIFRLTDGNRTQTNDVNPYQL